MAKKQQIGRIANQYGIEQTEKALFFFFLRSKSIGYSESALIQNYFADAEFTKQIERDILTLNIQDIHELEDYLELLIPDNHKKINGAFFTPSYVVNYIINEIAPKASDRNLDPSCGTGAFLLGLIEYYQQNFKKSVKKILRENIYGVDILDYNCRRVEIILAIYALMNDEIVDEQDLNIYQGNTLKMQWERLFDNVVGNPPYVKFQDLDKKTREELYVGWETSKKGTYNLYFSFFELGYSLLKEGGKLGYITPNNYFTSLAGEPLRRFFHNTQSVYRIIDFNDVKVFDAQTYTALTFLQKQKNQVIYFDRINGTNEASEFLKNVNGSPVKITDLNLKKWRLLKIDEQHNIRQIESVGSPLGQLFHIRVGIATLKDELYFVDKTHDTGEFFLKEYNGKTFEIEKEITKTIYKISDFPDSKGFVKNKRAIIFPYKKTGNRNQPIEEKEMQQKYPRCYEYFLAIKKELQKRDKGGKQLEPFYLYGRSQGINHHGVKILTPTFSQQPRFTPVFDKSALFCNGYGLYFKTNELPFNPIALKENLNALLNVLNSDLMDYYIKKTSVAIQGGYPCYQKNFIERFSIPSFTSGELEFLNNAGTEDDINDFLSEKYHLSIPLPKRLS